jgi:hypothetical protein
MENISKFKTRKLLEGRDLRGIDVGSLTRDTMIQMESENCIDSSFFRFMKHYFVFLVAIRNRK